MLIRDGLSDLIFLGIWWSTLLPGLILSASVFLLYRMGDRFASIVAGTDLPGPKAPVERRATDAR
jgi:hypothetical protein